MKDLWQAFSVAVGGVSASFRGMKELPLAFIPKLRSRFCLRAGLAPHTHVTRLWLGRRTKKRFIIDPVVHATHRPAKLASVSHAARVGEGADPRPLGSLATAPSRRRTPKRQRPR